MASQKPNSSHRNALVIRFSAIGDVAMTVPVIYSACRCHPDVTFHLLTRPAMAGIFVNPPANLHVIKASLKDDYRGIGGLMRLARELCAKWAINCCVDLQGSRRTLTLDTLLRLRGIPVTVINKGLGRKHALTRRHNKVMLPLVSQRARYREAFFRAGFPIQEQFDGLYGHARGDESLFAAITPPKRADERWVGIAPFALYKGKIYPPELMEQVVAEISKLPDVRIFLLGGGDAEQAALDAWAERYPRTVSLAGRRYGFAVELSLLSHLDVIVSMDSANMHLASIVNIPVVSVWGATHPYCGFKGWRQAEGNTIQLPMPCRPCSVMGDKPCHSGDYHCLAGIPPQVIIDKVLRMIK